MSVHTPKAYKRDSKGKLRYWQAEIVGGAWRVETGIEGGTPVFSTWKQTTTKNPGKKNERLPPEQAHLEAFAAYDIQLREDYHSTPQCTDWKPPFPMLANKFEGMEEGTQFFSQPKLDGVRCLTFLKDGAIRFYSRKGQPFPDFPHIGVVLEPFFEKHPNAILDGELYNHEYHDDFNSIVSAVKAGDVEQASLLQYWVYDMASGTDRFSWRSSWLKANLPQAYNAVVLVPTYFVTSNITLQGTMERYLAEGFEGQMLRKDLPYEQAKRSKSLLKHKEFMDEEFALVSINEGIGNYSGCAKSATFRMKDGRAFNAQIKGPRSDLKLLLAQYIKWCVERGGPPEDCVATVKFFRYTPDGIPRFPTVKTIWWEGRDV